MFICVEIDFSKMATAMEATAALISYLELLIDDNNFDKFKLHEFSLKPYMRLDSSALSALNLFPGRGESSTKTTNLFGLLNRCKTVMGSRHLMQYIRQPLLNREAISNTSISTQKLLIQFFFFFLVRRQDIVEALMEDYELRSSLVRKLPISSFKYSSKQTEMLKTHVPSDLEKITKKIVCKKAQLKDCYFIYCFVTKLPEILLAFEKYSGTKEVIQQDFTIPLRV